MYPFCNIVPPWCCPVLHGAFRPSWCVSAMVPFGHHGGATFGPWSEGQEGRTYVEFQCIYAVEFLDLTRLRASLVSIQEARPRRSPNTGSRRRSQHRGRCSRVARNWSGYSSCQWPACRTPMLASAGVTRVLLSRTSRRMSASHMESFGS